MLLTLVFVFATSCVFIKFYREKDYSKEGTFGNLASTIGVLGTFVGISVGLMGFDPNNITESVPKLLDGMQIAFITSVVGMSASIIMKFIALKNTKEEEDIDDIIELFNTMIKESRNVNETLKQNQSQIQIIFNQMNETWNLNQCELKDEIRDLNNNTISKQEELISEFKSFGSEMTKNNTEALIVALNNVIKDFNNKISEQFGENFKELNHAVAALLVWQENYKSTIEITVSQLDKTVESIINIDDSMKRIKENSTLIEENNNNLKSVLEDIADGQYKLKIGLNSLVEVSDLAIKSIPNIDKYFENSNIHIMNTISNLENSIDNNLDIVENHIEKLTLNVSQASAESMEEIKEVIAKSSHNFEYEALEYLNNFEKMTNQLKECIPDINQHLLQTQERFTHIINTFTMEVQNVIELNKEHIVNQADIIKNSINVTNRNLEGTISDSTKRLEDITVNTSGQISNMVENMEQVFEQKVDQLDKLLEAELTKALNSLAGQLVTISEQFTKDYIPLADKLRHIVMIAEGVR